MVYCLVPSNLLQTCWLGEKKKDKNGKGAHAGQGKDENSPNSKGKMDKEEEEMRSFIPKRNIHLQMKNHLLMSVIHQYLENIQDLGSKKTFVLVSTNHSSYLLSPIHYFGMRLFRQEHLDKRGEKRPSYIEHDGYIDIAWGREGENVMQSHTRDTDLNNNTQSSGWKAQDSQDELKEGQERKEAVRREKNEREERVRWG